ncbi:MAG TPA: aminoacyl--tRNA ligase-related protein, partial [Allosphingosinicella sp.]
MLESEGRPLTFLEITEKSIAQNLLSHVGKTPELTMLSRLAAMARRTRDRKVVVTAKDTFALADWALPEDAEALALTGVMEAHPEDSLPPLRPVERHPEPRTDNVRVAGRGSERKRRRDEEEEAGRGGRRRRFPPIPEVVFEILSESDQALRPDQILEQARTKELAAEVRAAEAAQAEAEVAWQTAIMSIPNLAHEQAPAGGEDDYTVLETVGTPRDFEAEGFEPRDHVELGRILGAIDMERGAKVSGSRFYFLTGVGAQLELALVNLAMEQARAAGFTQVVAPSLVRPRAMEGTGFLGQAADDVYRIEGEDLYLVGTSEVPMAAYHSDEILDAASLPRRYAAYSPCYRKEAGSYGKDTSGIIRVHWFDKVEMFTYTTVEESYAEH